MSKINLTLIKAKSISYDKGTRNLKKVEYIVFHYTAGEGDTAKNEVDYFANSNNREAGAHIFVDQKGKAFLSIPLNRTAWSVGGFFTQKNGAGRYYNKCTNYNSVSIEMCDCASKDPSDKMMKTIKAIVAWIQSKCKNAKTIIRHWDVNGKDCPLRMKGKNNDKWANFLDYLGYDPKDGIVVSDDKVENGSGGGGSDDDSSRPALEIDWEKLNPYIITVNRNTGKNDINYAQLLNNHIPAVMIEAGRYFTSKHKVAKTFRNPKAYEQAQKCIKNKLEYGFYFIGRARSAAEAEKELYELSFIVRKYPPTLGVWVNVDLTDKKTVNDIVLKTYEKGFLRLGLADKYGIYCGRKFLKKISWDKFQDTWWLWLKDKVSAKKEIQRLIDPKFFDTDNKSGPIIGNQNYKYDESSTFKQGDGKYTGKFQRPINKKSYHVSCEYSGPDYSSGNHIGIDLAAAAGVDVHAVDGGTVIEAKRNPGGRGTGSYGNCVVIKHDSKFTTRYAHLKSFDCKKGDKVTKGQKIGEVDSTGDSTGNHLHFEVVVNGTRKNPRDYIQL